MSYSYNLSFDSILGLSENRDYEKLLYLRIKHVMVQKWVILMQYYVEI